MVVLIALLILSLSFYSAFLLGKQRVIIKKRRLQKKSFYINQNLIDLLYALQKHRGLHSRYLGGEYSLKHQCQAIVKNIFQDIAKADQNFDEQLINIQRWDDIRQQWSNLLKQKDNMTLDQSFSQHCMIIEKLLYLMVDVAEKGKNDLENSIDANVLDIVWNKLPLTTENIGQARAIGSGVTTLNYCSSEKRIKLLYLKDTIQTGYNHTMTELGNITVNEAGYPQLLKEAGESLNDFLRTLNNKVIVPETPKIDSEEYFKIASQALNHVSKLIDIILEQIDQKRFC